MKFKEKIALEFQTFTALLSLGFIVMTIFAVVKCMPIAMMSLLLICIVGVVYPTRWLILAIYELLVNRGYIIIGYDDNEQYDIATHTYYREGRVLAKSRSLSGIKRFIRQTFGFEGVCVLADGTISCCIVEDIGAEHPFYKEGFQALLRNNGLYRLQALKVEDYAEIKIQKEVISIK